MSSSRISVLGVYSPKANQSEFDAYLHRTVASYNPINFSAETRALFRRLGRDSELVALPEEELAEIREDIDTELSAAALVEVFVEQPDGAFDVGEFQQRKKELPPDQWKVGWSERFLTPDGDRLLGDYSFGEVPSDERFRVVFYIHCWEQERGLHGPNGPLSIPAIEPMPRRLWLLAPYKPELR